MSKITLKIGNRKTSVSKSEIKRVVQKVYKNKEMDKGTIYKELLKTKVKAYFSSYVAGSLYYDVELSDGKYRFPITIIDSIPYPGPLDTTIEKIQLSSDLGTTPFHSEIRASELNRYIAKAIDSGEFIRL